MNKVLVISDSFKGTLSSRAICDMAVRTVPSVLPGCAVTALPVADGGEGTVDCFLQAAGGEKVSLWVTGPWGTPVEAYYGRVGESAVVEMAAAAGLPLARHRDPSQTTTYGVGELMRHAVEHGAKRLVLGLGGSATHDGGCGAAAALGVKFYRTDGTAFCPVGATLREIDTIDCTEAEALLKGVTVEVMCDIDNPLCGPRGAAAVFAPQKGADAAMVARLEDGLRHLDAVFTRQLGRFVAQLPGAGAAGGFGAGAAALLGAALRPGIEVVLDLVDFERHLIGCDLVLTGEGRLDSQSLGGKVPVGVARRAKAAGVPVVALVGTVGPGIEAVYDLGITAVFVTNRQGAPFEAVAHRAEADYAAALKDILSLLRALEHG